MPEATPVSQAPGTTAKSADRAGNTDVSTGSPLVRPANPAVQALLVVRAMRPRQWPKNLLLFAGVVFAGRLFDGASSLRAILAFGVFCLLSGATYLINDLADIESDRRHPTKRYRALASGRLTPLAAWLGIALALALAAWLTEAVARVPFSSGVWHLAAAGRPPWLALQRGHGSLPGDIYTLYGGSSLLFALMAAAYFALMLAYTFRLKHVVLLDVFTIAGGFVIRAMAGAVVVAVRISPWLYLCTILLALFLALGKRRQELMLLDASASGHRRSLTEYSLPLLDHLMTIVTSATIMAYSLYTFQNEAGNPLLMATIPFVLYGIFRYLYLVYMRGEGGSPEEVLLRDAHVRWSVVLCVITIGVVLYVLPK